MPAAGTVVNWKVRHRDSSGGTFNTSEVVPGLVIKDNGGVSSDIVVFYDHQQGGRSRGYIRIVKAIPNAEFI
jgi:hypothetical protein